MMSLIPTRKQWKKWSLPSKFTAISTFLSCLGLLIYLFILAPILIPIITPKFNYQKYHKQFAQCLLDFSLRNYPKAQVGLKNLTKNAPDNDLKDIYAWLSESFSRNKQYENAFQTAKEYYQKIANSPTFEELQYLALVRLITLINSDKFSDLLHHSKKLINNGALSKLKEIEALAYLLNGEQDEVISLFNSNKYEFETADYFRINQYTIWGYFASYFSGELTRLEYLLSLMFQYNANPEAFERDYFCIYQPFYNLTLQSMGVRMGLQKTYEATLKNVKERDVKIFSNYKKELIDFGLSIGSQHALKLFLDNNDYNSKILISKISKIKQKDEFNLVFSPLIRRDRLYILWATGEQGVFKPSKIKQKKENSDYRSKYDRSVEIVKFLGKVNLRLIEIIKGEVNIARVKFPDGDSANCFWFHIEPMKYEEFQYLLVTTVGTSHSKEMYGVSVNSMKVSRILPDDEQEDYSYHSHNTYYSEVDGKPILRWRFEVYNSCDPNVTRKVFGVCEYSIEPYGRYVLIRRWFPNPALEFFENLNKSALMLQNFLIKKLTIQERQIRDDKFKQYVTEKSSTCYRTTSIDEAYANMPKLKYPRISSLLIHIPPSDDDLIPPGIDLSEVIRKGDNYLILVKRFETDVKVLDIFEIKDAKIIKSVFLD